jgi:hypothetical protein
VLRCCGGREFEVRDDGLRETVSKNGWDLGLEDSPSLTLSRRLFQKKAPLSTHQQMTTKKMTPTHHPTLTKTTLTHHSTAVKTASTAADTQQKRGRDCKSCAGWWSETSPCEQICNDKWGHHRSTGHPGRKSEEIDSSADFVDLKEVWTKGSGLDTGRDKGTDGTDQRTDTSKHKCMSPRALSGAHIISSLISHARLYLVYILLVL